MTKWYREILIGLLFIGLLAVILSPWVYDTLERAKVRRAISDILSAGTAWFSWLTDQVVSEPIETAGESPPAGESRGSAADLSTLNASASTFDIEKLLPDEDPWGNPYEYTHADSPSAASVIQIRCFGRDGKEGGTGFDADIVWADGFFVRYPAGAQVD